MSCSKATAAPAPTPQTGFPAGDLGRGQARDPRPHHGGDLRPCIPAVGLELEINALLLLDSREGVAEAAGLSLAGVEIVDAPYSHAAATTAVEMVRRGRLQGVMKGSLHTDELMRAVVHEGAGLRTERRISHVFVIDTPGYHKLLLVTDAAINIAPTLEEKADIVRNAIDLENYPIYLPDGRSVRLSAIATVADGAAMPAALAAAWAWHESPAKALMVAVSVLIVTCPCALSLATPAAMLAAAGNLARQGVLLRDVQTLETLSRVDAVVFDKSAFLPNAAFQVPLVFALSEEPPTATL